jgi:hypothetical protein
MELPSVSTVRPSKGAFHVWMDEWSKKQGFIMRGMLDDPKRDEESEEESE